jgi:hypothetical protein
MPLRPPYCFPRAYPYARLKPIPFHVDVICANWFRFGGTTK